MSDPSAPRPQAAADAALSALSAVTVVPLAPDRFRDVLDPDAFLEWQAMQVRARRALEGRTVWCVNSTASGGGVAEMLRTLLAYSRGAGIDARWVVLPGDPRFFAITKRLHNRLHGIAGDGGPLGPAERAHYEATTAAAAAAFLAQIGRGDLVILHDPQTAGMAPALRDAGVRVLWRLHIGADDADGHVEEAQAFLRPYVEAADAWVFSRARHVWPGLERARVHIVPPSIDAFSPKNALLDEDGAEAILHAAGLRSGGDGRATFLREDGSGAEVTHRASVDEDRPLRDGERYVLQVSRWDALKDPRGIAEAFAAHAGDWQGAHLLLAGPACDSVADDPEAAEVLADVAGLRRALPAAVRERVHLVSLPTDDEDENAAIVNALQQRAAVVVQKSLAEGFGLTVTEAMWKARPIVAARVGGIQDQIADGVHGLLVDPRDLDAFAAAVASLLADPARAEALGAAAHARARAEFLATRHLAQWARVLETLLDA